MTKYLTHCFVNWNRNILWFFKIYMYWYWYTLIVACLVLKTKPLKCFLYIVLVSIRGYYPMWETASILFFFPHFFFISWRLITLQYCSGFCHTLTWISHGYTCIPHPDPPSHLSLHLIPLGLPSAPGPSTCLMHPTWAGDLETASILSLQSIIE